MRSLRWLLAGQHDDLSPLSLRKNSRSIQTMKTTRSQWVSVKEFHCMARCRKLVALVGSQRNRSDLPKKAEPQVVASLQLALSLQRRLAPIVVDVPVAVVRHRSCVCSSPMQTILTIHTSLEAYHRPLCCMGPFAWMHVPDTICHLGEVQRQCLAAVCVALLRKTSSMLPKIPTAPKRNHDSSYHHKHSSCKGAPAAKIQRKAYHCYEDEPELPGS